MTSRTRLAALIGMAGLALAAYGAENDHGHPHGGEGGPSHEAQASHEGHDDDHARDHGAEAPETEAFYGDESEPADASGASGTDDVDHHPHAGEHGSHDH
jgi:hypothetical protein